MFAARCENHLLPCPSVNGLQVQFDLRRLAFHKYRLSQMVTPTTPNARPAVVALKRKEITI
jgi:hypothetical protein